MLNCTISLENQILYNKTIKSFSALSLTSVGILSGAFLALSTAIFLIAIDFKLKIFAQYLVILMCILLLVSLGVAIGSWVKGNSNYIDYDTANKQKNTFLMIAIACWSAILVNIVIIVVLKITMSNDNKKEEDVIMNDILSPWFVLLIFNLVLLPPAIYCTINCVSLYDSTDHFME